MDDNVQQEETPVKELPSQGQNETQIVSGSKRKRVDADGKEHTLSGRKRTSEVWQVFTLPVHDKAADKFFSSCIYCGKTYAVDVNNTGTSTLLTHKRKCKKIPTNQVDPTQAKLVFKGGEESVLSNWTFDQLNCMDAMIRMLVLNELPFRFVESEGFRLFLEAICPMFVVTSRHTVNRDIAKLYKKEKCLLKNYIVFNKPRVCLTTDTWTFVQQINYMCLTLHFIDCDWVLHKRIINFCPIVSHKGEDLGKAVEKCLLDWGVESILTVTVDNATSNDSAISYLKRKFNNGKAGVLDGRFMHMRCIAHIINLIVQDGISMVGKSVEKIRAAVRFIKQSPARIFKFKMCADLKKIDSSAFLCLDVPTRWNSTFLMLKSAIVFENVFELYADEDMAFKYDLQHRTRKDTDELLGLINDDDWHAVRQVMNFLQHFYLLTNRVSGSSYTTANGILDEISDTFTLLKTTISSPNSELAAMASKMLDKFDKYWGDISKINLLIFIAQIFDPRHKMIFVKYVIQFMYPASSEILLGMVDFNLHELFDEYVKLHYVPTPSSNTGLSNVDSLSLSQPTGDNELPMRGVLAAQFFASQSSSTQSLKSELDKYLQEDLEPFTNSSFNILNWWNVNSVRYPVVSRMARDVLAIPISTVSSESAFSTGGRVLSDYRSCLSTGIVEALICVQDWIRKSAKQVNYEQEVIEEEEAGKEFKMFEEEDD